MMLPPQAPVDPAPRPERWEEHWSAYDEATRHNPAQRYRRKLIVSAMTSAEQSLRVLDLGCGQGDLLAELGRRFPAAELVGLDASQAGLASTRQKVPRARLFQVDFAAPEPFPEVLYGFASHAVCSEVLEHLDHPRLLLEKTRPLLARGGELIVTVPGGPRTAFDVHLGHRRHYSVSDLVSLLGEAGYEPAVAQGAGFPFFNLYKLLILLRGRWLSMDLDQSRGISGMALAAMKTFDWLFHLNHSGTGLGWQIFAIFRPCSPHLPVLESR